MRPITWAGIIVVVVIVLGAGWYFRSPIKHLFVKDAAPVVETPPADPTASWSTYASTTLGVAIKYPAGFTINEAYAYDQFGPKKLVHGVALTIPATMATGTNLSSDTRLSVEQLPRAKKCTADIFIPTNVVAVSLADGGIQYSVATTSGAAAGNRYEETVYAVADSQPCTAVRYFVHYGVIENYPAGAVQEFDRTALINQFDAIRRTMQLTGNTPAPVTNATSTP
jgi:hypothetical protein